MGSRMMLIVACCFAACTAAGQSSSPSFTVPRQSIDNGGGRSSGTALTLDGVIGQPDAAAAMSSASYTLRGGLLPSGESPERPDPLFNDGFE